MCRWKEEPYGATFVSNRICLSLRSCTSGRLWRCFSKELRRSGDAERGVSSMAAAVVLGSIAG